MTVFFSWRKTLLSTQQSNPVFSSGLVCCLHSFF